MAYQAESYETIVIGAGHAGCEAALATARKGHETLLLAINLDSVAMMPCNPSIGGTGKGHLVREIDALGGEMGKNIDATMIQCKMLNTGKGPAVHSLRAQADKKAYQFRMKEVIENTPHLTLRQQEATKLIIKDGTVTGVQVRTGATYACKTCVVCTGTYLNGKIFMGEVQYSGGPNGMFPANFLSDSLREAGFDLQRFKTGTPARVDEKTLDYSKMKVQKGDDEITPFSFETDHIDIDQIDCYLTYTNEKTHKIIRDNLDRSPLVTGDVVGVGPRYCPSIETKVVRFADKDHHQMFMEPEGLHTREVYVQGMSSCLPEEVQITLYRTVPGMEHVQFMRSAYAIEYDCIHPTALKATLESKDVKGLFFAGQINGTSGYEEAGAQGIVAGINAGLLLEKAEPMILDRSQAYIGVLIDDIINEDATEPYRMMTSRAEYRLLLRQDNADLRLTPIGRRVGLISDERYARFLKKKADIEAEKQRLKSTIISPSEKLNAILDGLGTAPVNSGVSLAQLLKRPELSYAKLAPVDPGRPELSKAVQEEVEIQIKYDGYIQKQLRQVVQFKKLEEKRIPEGVHYDDIEGLRLEAVEKLKAVRPMSIGQASRISGVNPADIAVLHVYLESHRELYQK
ncbi:tRNA uridine-5-carboxymethylaminomethyl(34) synthesis enzyme MnmG [Pseudoramibacter sp.]|jgi:tRNA uridine 5-carboxymethylaminomethyl modification enzyme|uniref:tRNA uridine-5-carboxymethylaminomethyl(34) synthesis enzyme MnmG n=1 Tax=Pseudoramibacter sp. TaxID=2034862 RepID=UPI0025EF3969|nr:tRNA uridine-5-carboxymethylaminomethyl(34) synthesis enzyme MnmG [Pseudoramibacter sp.]MCH4071923.1 tRNA uridine-5-carboxymethylaminomethyl(34) synthesis enzyme MnmG [Pseudoramibacter sp.]MCH4105691.1 tRNA uridine-5-carboxymethylaminomethyl(34) synthesis enzyme MnmG [Pseudoramibacter sp.]